MLTYDMSDVSGPLYKYLYECIKKDINTGMLECNAKMPSKRTLAENLGVSTITVENAYEQLIGEGYMYTIPKRGYFISDISQSARVVAEKRTTLNIKMPKEDGTVAFDFSSGRTESKTFPFSIWAKLMRETMSLREGELLKVSPCSGVAELREAIAKHLNSFRGMSVDPRQIIVGAGTEYLYGLLIKLLGKNKTYCIENPGYKKIRQIYESNDVRYTFAGLDDQGIIINEIMKSDADIAHISSTHHFPTGITMPVTRRYELLAWANEKNGRYIIEDDYDSEFRLNGKPIPPVLSIDACEKVIYINTFSKSLTSTIRIGYMVLPEHLANEFYEKLSFYSCTVSTFEQYTLAKFISQGYFEKHINRMRLYYGRKRKRILEVIRQYLNENECRIIENDSGLHFLLEFKTNLSDNAIEDMLMKNGIRLKAITDFDISEQVEDRHQFILDYSNLNIDGIENAVEKMKKILDNYLEK